MKHRIQSIALRGYNVADGGCKPAEIERRSTMTKAQMIKEILLDMYKQGDIESVNRRFRGYLKGSKKAEIETIYNNRFNKKEK